MKCVEVPVIHRGQVVAYAKVDPADGPRLLEHRWHLRSGYAVRYERVDGVQKNIWMHREVLGQVPLGMVPDHVDRDRLNNCRRNLRILSKVDNLQNATPRRRSASRHRGVIWNKQRMKWQAKHSLRGAQHHIGFFECEDEAGLAAASWRKANMPFSAEALDDSIPECRIHKNVPTNVVYDKRRGRWYAHVERGGRRIRRPASSRDDALSFAKEIIKELES